MNVSYENDKILMKQLFGTKELKASEIRRIRLKPSGLVITLRNDKEIPFKHVKYSFDPEGPLKFAYENSIDYEEEGAIDQAVSSLQCNELIEALLTKIQEYGQQQIKEQLGPQYDFTIERHFTEYRKYIIYWVTEDGKKVELPGYEACENGVLAIGDMELCWLVKLDPTSNIYMYGLVSELKEDGIWKEYIESEIKFFMIRQKEGR